MIHAVRKCVKADFATHIFDGRLLNNYTIYATDITQSNSLMVNVPIDQYVF